MISCALSSDQIKNLYKHTYNAMKSKLSADKSTAFDASEYMQTLFDEISKRENPETAAKFLQQIPKFINILATTKFASKIGSVKGLTDVVIPAIQEFSSEDSIPNIIEKFTKSNKNDVKNIRDAAELNKLIQNATILEEGPAPENVKAPERYKSFNVFSGTLNEFKKVKPSEKDTLTAEQLDETRVAVGDIVSMLNDQFLMQEDFTKPFIYQGKTIKIKATNFRTFAQKNRTAIDEATVTELVDSYTAVKKGYAKEDVTQADDRVILVVTDENGKNIYFDKNGNITKKHEGNLAYQLLRDIRETPEGFRVTDIYGIEDQIAPIETVAEETYVEQLDGNYNDYVKKLTKEREADLKKLFALKNKAKTEDVMLDFAGMSPGLPQSLSGSRIPLSELIKFPGIKSKTLEGIKTLAKKRGNLAKGRAYININGNNFEVERSQITEEVIQQLMDVLLSPTIPYELKERFYSQFLPENKDVTLSYKMRKHSIMPNENNKSFKIKLYSKIGTEKGFDEKDLLVEKTITNKNLQAALPEDIAKFRTQFETALREGTKKNEPTYMSYPSETKSKDFILYDRANKEFVPAVYADYLQTLNGEVVIAGTNPGFFNRNMLFHIPSTFNETVEKVRKETEDLKKETPVSAKVIKDALVDRLNKEELITGTITRPPGSGTGYEFTEPNGNKAYFFNHYKKDPSVTQLDITSEDSLEGAYLVLNPFKEADGKVFTDVVEVYDANGNLVGNVQETDFASDLKEQKPETVAIDLALNVISSTKNGMEMIINDDNSIKMADEAGELSKLKKYGKTNYYINNEILGIIIEGRDMFDRPGGRTIVNVKVPDNFNETLFAKFVKDIKYPNNTTVTETNRVLFEIKDAIQKSVTKVKSEKLTQDDLINKEKEAEIIKETEDPEIPTPESPFSKINFNSFQRAGYNLENVTKEELDAVEDFWNNTPLGQDMQKYISPVTMFNIINSNVNAEFIVNAAALLNPEIKTLGSININPNKGTFVDLYHEAWHVFTQLYMTKEQKKALYKEVKNFKDANGKQPYLKMSAFQIEEMLAEDFREYMKKAYTKKGMPQRNTIFRIIMNFLKSLFGKKIKTNTVNLTTDAMAVPSVRELFTKLNLSDKHPELLNDYSASISNVRFFELDRGVRSVANSRESVLSEQDAKLMVDSMDMIISEMIDDLYKYRKGQGQTAGLKSGTLKMLLDPEQRPFTFTYVKEKLQEKLKEEKEKLEHQDNVVTINKINTLEQLKENAVAILKTKTGDDKYVLLSSQIDGFENLEPDIKKGGRIKGEDWHKIKIVGDFFKHKTIEKDGKKVGIIVVSRQSDAVVQYENYKNGGADTYTEVVLNDVPNYELTQDQEFILDNIRILQAAIDNFGEPDYDAKNQAPQGMLAYYNQNSDFEIGKNKYYVDVTEEKDENGDEIDEFLETTEGSSEILKDKLTGKKSMLQLAQKEVLYILKSLHKVNRDGSIPKNRLGYKEKADFRKVWNIVYKATSGIRNREVAYNKLLDEAAKFPEIQQLMEFKYPDPTKITNTFEQDISSSFWQTFSKPSATYKQFTMFPQMGIDFNPITGEQKEVVVDYESDVTDSSLEIYSTVKKFEANFKGSLGTKYIFKNVDNQSILDTNAIIKDFSNRSGEELNTDKAFEFVQSLGINLDNTPVIKKDLNDKLDYYGVEFIYDIVDGFNAIENNKATATQKQLEYLNKFKSNPIDTVTNEIPVGVLSNFKGPVLEKTSINRLAELQVTYGYDSANPGMLLPDGNLVYGTLNHSEVSVLIDGINTIENLSDMWKNPDFKYMSGFNPSKNTFTLRSKLFGTIFNTKDPKKEYAKRKGKGIEHLFTAGTKIGTDGTNTTDLDPVGKFMQGMHTMLLDGVEEFIRMAEKKSSFGARVSGGIPKFISPIYNISKGDDANLWVDVSMFRNIGNNKYTNGELFAIDNYFIDYIAVEFDRIRMFKQNKDEFRKIKGFNRVVGKNKKGEDIYAGEVFTQFDNILRRGTQVDLYKLIQDPLIDLPSYLKTNSNLRDKIIEDIADYFNETIAELKKDYLDKTPFLDKKLASKLGYTQDQIDKNKDLLRSDEVENALLKAYAYNDWIQKFEMGNLFLGDSAQYNHDKQELSKRAPGSTSDGDAFLSDKSFQNFINNTFNKVTYATKESERTGEELDNFEFDGTFNTGVIADAVRTSIYLPDYQKAWTEYYTDLLKNKYKGEELKEQVEKRVAKDSEPYEKMTESDGCGLIAFDAYRLLKKAANAWGPPQESLYQDIIAGVNVDPKKVKQFFSVYKLHYYGDIANSPIAAKAMHKFALNPIIPTVAVKGTAMYDLHVKMMKDNIQYVLFGSGSKVSTLTDRTDGEFDNIFGDKDMTSVNKDAYVTPNVIYLEYLKDVTKVADKLKNEISVPTQQRMVVLDSLFNAGNLRNVKNKEAVENYDNAVAGYTNILEKELLNKIGYELKDGKYQGKLDKLVELIREELGAKEVPENLIKLLDTSVNDSLSMDFSIHPESDVIEKVIVNRIQKTIVKQKTKGEAMVQMPSTFYNGIWDTPYKIEKDPKLIKKYLGSNNLPFYTQGEIINQKTGERANTNLMKVAIPLNGDFLNLLNLKHNDKQPIGDIDRLNEMIKNDEWLAKHREVITITGPRIPTDKANVIVGAEVWHFLDAAAGNTVIVPSEIVAAAGSDFDVDKIFFMFPNITSKGELVQEVEGLDEKIAKINEAKKKNPKLKGPDSLIAQQKKYLQNKLIKDTVALLSLPENFVLLTKPNATYLVEDNIKFFEKVTKQYSEKKTRHKEDVRTNGGKEVMSPTRTNELAYNLSVFDKNLTGSKPLGIFAKKNKTHVIYKSIGGKLPSSYKATVWDEALKKYRETDTDYNMVLRLNHNKVKNAKGQTVISLGGELNVDYEKIGDIISHGLQGLLDRAKNPFPKTLNIITESSPIILHLIETGAGVMDALATINIPLAVEYFNQQQILGSSTGRLIEPDLAKHQVKGFAAAKVVKKAIELMSEEQKEEIKQLVKGVNLKRMYDVLDNLKKEDKNKEYAFLLAGQEEPMKAKLADILGNNSFAINEISELREYNPEKTSFRKMTALFKYSGSLTNNDNYYYAAQAMWKKAFGDEETISLDELKDIVAEQDPTSFKGLAMFLHLIQVEKQSKGMSDLEIMFNPDTGLLDTTLLVKKRDEAYKNFSEMSKIDLETLDRLRYKSLLSSFYKSKLILDIVLPLFPLRLNQSIQDFLSDKLLDQRDFITQRYGAGQKGQERFINSYNNAIINYIFQNSMSNFKTPIGEIVELPETYHGIPVTKTENQSVPVILKNGELLIDREKAEADYKAKVFLEINQSENSHAARGLDTFKMSENPFKNLDSYVQYLTELEYLKSINTQEDLVNDKRYQRFVKQSNSEEIGYTKYLSEKALMNTFNNTFIMGTTKYSYTDMVMDIIKEFDSENLKERFPVLNQLSPVKTVKEVNVIELNNKADAKGTLAESYYMNLRQLADPSVRKVINKNKAIEEADNKRITEVFKDFSLMMFYQHGTGYSKYGFTKVLDPVDYVKEMQPAANSFLNNNLNTAVFEQVYNRMMIKSMFKNYLVKADNYTDPKPLTQEEIDEMSAEANAAILAMGSIETELGQDDVNEDDPIEGPTETSPTPTNAAAEYTNHSGGAIGSDTQWDIIGKEFGMVNNRHYYTGEKGPKNAPLGNVDITNNPIAVEGASKVAQAAKQMWGYKYNTMKDQRLIRNWAQVANSDAVFAIGTLGKEGDIWKGDEKSAEPRKLLKFAVQGGTGYAVEMAIQAGKPVYVFDQVRNQWYKNINGEWSKSEVPTLTKNFAGIGTREINEAGKQAIRDVYANTFKATTQPTGTVGEVKEGVSELFESNPELANIGTPEQYSQYLDTIFPDSKVKDIYQHSSNTDLQKEGFKKGFGKSSDAFFFDKIDKAEYAGKYNVKVLLNIKNTFNRYNTLDEFIKAKYGKDSIKNIKEEINLERQGYVVKYANEKAFDEYMSYMAEENPDSESSQFIKRDRIDDLQKYGNFDSIDAQGYIGVFEPEQIHILGTNQDIEGFRNFVSTQPTEKPLREEDFNLELKDRITILEAELADLEEAKQEILDRSVPVLIATNLPKIKPESARRETGVAVGTSKDINPGLLSNNGVSVERAAEMLSENLFYEGSGFPEIDVQDIRDYIIDILQTGVKNYVDEFTDQNKIDNLKAEIAALKEEQRLSKEGNTGIQLDLFSDENAPEGYPSIPRTPKQCE